MLSFWDKERSIQSMEVFDTRPSGQAKIITPSVKKGVRIKIIKITAFLDWQEEQW